MRRATLAALVLLPGPALAQDWVPRRIAECLTTAAATPARALKVS